MRKSNTVYQAARLLATLLLSAVFAVSQAQETEEPIESPGLPSPTTPEEPAPTTPEEPTTPAEPTPTTPADILSSLPGSSELQSASGFTMGTMCPALAALGNEGQLNESQRELSDRCTELVVTGLRLNDEEASLPIEGFDTVEELNAALQQVASEEALAATTIATESMLGQARSVAGRLARVRRLSNVNVASASANSPTALTYAQRPDALSGGAAGDASIAPGWGIFLSGRGGFGEDDGTDREDSFDFIGGGFTIGMDYRVRDDLTAGLAVGFDSLDADFNSSATVSDGDLKADSISASLFATYYPGDFYVDAIATFGVSRYDMDRTIVFPGQPDVDANANTNSRQFAVGVSGGYDYKLGNATVGPIVRADYLHVELNDFTERDGGALAMRVEGEDVDSLVSGLGVQAQQAFSTGFGVVTASLRGEWLHEFMDDAQTVRSFYVNDPTNTALELRTDNPDRDYFTVAVGATAVMPNGLQTFVQYETLLGHRDISSHVFSVGGRWDF